MELFNFFYGIGKPGAGHNQGILEIDSHVFNREIHKQHSFFIIKFILFHTITNLEKRTP
jgi:hypothetical protein